MPAGLVLVTPPGNDSELWQPLENRARRAGIWALTVSLAIPGQERIAGELESNEVSLLLDQIETAAAVVRERGMGDGPVILAGAGLGANLVLRCSANMNEPPGAVVALSPGFEYRGVDIESIMGSLDKTPLLLMYAREDTYSGTACRELKRLAAGYSELREYDGGAHGLALLHASPQVSEQILLWLRPIVSSAPPSARDAAGASPN